jgi:hypothetical protein
VACREALGSRPMASEQIVQGLIRGRTAIGAGTWLAPRLSGRLFGLDASANPQLPYIARLFGVRDAALAVGLASSSGAQRSLWLRIGIACDLADAAAGLAAGRRGELPKPATVLVTAAAVGAAALGILALNDEPPVP